MLRTKRVSNDKIVVHQIEAEKIPAKGADLQSIAYSNTALFAKKGSGKTIVIGNMIVKFAGKNTVVILCVSTINKDPQWIRIVKDLEDRGISVLAYEDINDEDGANVIHEFLEEQKAEAEKQVGGAMQVIKPLIPFPRITLMGGNGKTNVQRVAEQRAAAKPPEQKKQPKPRVLYPDFIIVCDDLGKGMRDKYLTQLLKTNRHYKAKVILSAQNMQDLAPEQIRQLDYAYIFGRFPQEKLFKLKDELQIDMSDEEFLKLYRDATEKPFSFLYIGRLPTGDEFRKSFSDKYIL